MIYDFFEQNYILIYFIYGLFFFLMGFAIAMHIRFYRNISNLPLANSLWLLAAFGITHGLSEWAVVFIPIQGQYVSESTLEAFHIAKDLLVAVSFWFLFHFGASLTIDTLKKFKWLRYLPLGVFAFWLLNFIAFPLFVSTNTVWWMSASETWTRYLLAFPGGALSSYALCLQYHALKLSTHRSIANKFRNAALVFGLYAIVAGLVVPKAQFFPASAINVESFFYTFYIPVQVFRALSGMAMAYFIIRALEVFALENRKNLDEARRLNLLYQERNRIGRDLHDGIIQQIYAVGLQLENVYYLIEEDAEMAKNQIQMGMNGLNAIVKDLRNYILDLQPNNFQEPNLQQGLARLIDNFRANSLIHVDMRVEGEVRILPGDTCNQIYHIVQEGLNNILKHARATLVEIELGFLPDRMELLIKDNGQGFDPKLADETADSGLHRGLQNMLERSELIGAALEIKSNRSKGTQVKLILMTGGVAYGKD